MDFDSNRLLQLFFILWRVVGVFKFKCKIIQSLVHWQPATESYHPTQNPSDVSVVGEKCGECLCTTLTVAGERYVANSNHWYFSI